MKDGKRLAFQNTKSGQGTIHIADTERPESGSWYGWSECGNGPTRRGDHFYLSEDELSDDYNTRDGEIIGKLCGNCQP